VDPERAGVLGDLQRENLRRLHHPGGLPGRERRWGCLVGRGPAGAGERGHPDAPGHRVPDDLEYDELTDALTFWFSGARYEAGRYVWGAAVERRRRAEVFGTLGESIDIPFLPPAPAPLEDWP